ncbi:MFS transporter, partial [Candidatus Woesearchaeota archaeon]|nr:MFS transporter [Candidatus Woesearchaeota archaeon]
MRRNIAIIYATSALMWGRFFLPVLALFYVASQVSLEQFGFIMAAFALTTLVLEIPTGILADLLGKKKTLIIARLCYVVEIAILAFMNGFWPFLIAKVISGIGVSMSSGTRSALLYDSLRRSFKEHRHQETKGRVEAVTHVSMGIAFITGAYLFTIDPKLPAITSLPFISLALLLTFFLKEPYKPNKHLAFSNLGRHLRETLSYFGRHTYVRYLVFYGLPLTAAISILVSYSSAYYEHISIPIKYIGIIAFVVALV